jgi:hypothetical protein
MERGVLVFDREALSRVSEGRQGGGGGSAPGAGSLRSLPQPGISLWCAFPRMDDSVQQRARFSRIPRHTLADDLVAAERSRQFDTMTRPKEVQPASVPLLDGDVEDVERGDSDAARDSTRLDVMKAAAAAFRGPDPNDGAVFGDTLQRPRRSMKLDPVALTSP